MEFWCYRSRYWTRLYGRGGDFARIWQGGDQVVTTSDHMRWSRLSACICLAYLFSDHSDQGNRKTSKWWGYREYGFPRVWSVWSGGHRVINEGILGGGCSFFPGTPSDSGAERGVGSSKPLASVSASKDCGWARCLLAVCRALAAQARTAPRGVAVVWSPCKGVTHV